MAFDAAMRRPPEGICTGIAEIAVTGWVLGTADGVKRDAARPTPTTTLQAHIKSRPNGLCLNTESLQII